MGLFVAIASATVAVVLTVAETKKQNKDKSFYKNLSQAIDKLEK